MQTLANIFQYKLKNKINDHLIGFSPANIYFCLNSLKIAENINF